MHDPAEAGLSPGALRHHFPSQESLLGETAAAGLDAELLAPADVDDPDPQVRLVRAVEQFLPLGPGGPEAARVIVGLAAVSTTLPAVGSTLTALAGRAHASVVTWLEGTPDPSGTADEVLALVDGLTLQLVTGATSPERARRVVARRVGEWVRDGAGSLSPAPHRG